MSEHLKITFIDLERRNATEARGWVSSNSEYGCYRCAPIPIVVSEFRSIILVYLLIPAYMLLNSIPFMPPVFPYLLGLSRSSVFSCRFAWCRNPVFPLAIPTPIGSHVPYLL
ncbi:cytosolic Fe-S cluster assembly factor NUBP2 homolog [Striga asiatica]|uniref:Cytosolic Fe-S cluster assembly factor NUBP2 homolog n=1 Tax=Striga asiatica TaxID=4170 RepID=A0A5A7QJW5_STRAF|nr:cytosolic Fe-S cluster assembly factor NUBP2 homolog [Striga asiatica]